MVFTFLAPPVQSPLTVRASPLKKEAGNTRCIRSETASVISPCLLHTVPRRHPRLHQMEYFP